LSLCFRLVFGACVVWCYGFIHVSNTCMYNKKYRYVLHITGTPDKKRRKTIWLLLLLDEHVTARSRTQVTLVWALRMHSTRRGTNTSQCARNLNLMKNMAPIFPSYCRYSDTCTHVVRILTLGKLGQNMSGVWRSCYLYLTHVGCYSQV